MAVEEDAYSSPEGLTVAYSLLAGWMVEHALNIIAASRGQGKNDTATVTQTCTSCRCS